MATSELKPCPFCGSDAKYIEGKYSEDSFKDKPFVVYCENVECNVRMSHLPDWSKFNPYHKELRDCIDGNRQLIFDMWNTRAGEQHG